MNRTLIQAAGKCDMELLIRVLAGQFGPVEEQDLNDAMIRAAGVGYADIITCLIAKGADPDAEDPYGETPLIHAAAANHVRAVKLLLTAGAEVNWVNDSGRTALFMAVKNDCAASALLIMRSGTDCELDIQDDNNDTALISAASSDNALIVQILLQSKAKVDLQNYERKTALHKAVEIGSKICTMLLVEAKADVNIVDNRGNTPLLIACQNGFDDIGVMIMDAEQKPDIFLKDRLGKSVLDYAMEKQLSSVAEELFLAGAMDSSYAENLEPVMKAITTGNRIFLKALFSANYNLNQKGPVTVGTQQLSCTPLEASLRLGHIDMASLLMLGGSDFKTIGHWTQNPDTVPPEVAENHRAMAWLKIIPRRPSGLRSISRIELRKHLGFCPNKVVDSIVKIKSVKQYIMFLSN